MRIKHLFITVFVLLFNTLALTAAPFYNIERILTQPDGTILHCYTSGDEFYNRLHDANGYTIVQAENGFFVYATTDNEGNIIATQHIAGITDPASVGLTPNIKISNKEYLRKRELMKIPEVRDTKDLNHGVYNNLIIYIRFNGDAEMSSTKTEIDSMFNYDGYYDISMNNYFKKATYNQLSMVSYSYPEPDGETILSYEDIYPKEYYLPYNPTTNPNGYQEHQRAEREFALLKRAVDYIADDVPEDIDIDRNNDGYVDNVIFVVKGNVGNWNDLLWPHCWALYGENAYINGKQVWTFNFQLETSSYFSTSTLCHEMSHSLGLPDLYHYNSSYDYLSPAGSWDLMCGNAQPPQHTATYMKYKYGGWIDEIPEIGYGTYTIEANSWEGGRRNCYKIPSPDPQQFYLVEYRNKDNFFERGLPGCGLLIYRIDTRFDGCADYDGYYTFDEVYIFRPGGSQTENGNINGAAFSENSGNTYFNHTTNPYPFLNKETLDETLNICNISATGDQMTFTYCPINFELTPQNLIANVKGNNLPVELKWDAVESAESYNVYRDGELIASSITENSYQDEYQNITAGYHKYYVTSNCAGEESFQSKEEAIIIGDYCEYKINMLTTGENGWQGGEIKVSFDNNMDDLYFTIYSGETSQQSIVVPSGVTMTFSWLAGWDDTECSFNIMKNDEELFVSDELVEGVLTEIVASGEGSCVTPKNLTAEVNGSTVNLNWTSMVESTAYSIIRNGEVIAENITDNTFTDSMFPSSGYYEYNVISTKENCSSDLSNTAGAIVMTYCYNTTLNVEGNFENNEISLNWDELTVSGNIRYDNGINTGALDNSNRFWAIKVPASSMQLFEGTKINAVEILDLVANEYTFKIYNGEQTNESALIYSETFSAEGSGELLKFNLAEEVSFDANQDVWITVKPSSPMDVPYCDYIGDPSSCLIKYGSSWKSIVEFGQEYSWILRAYTTAPEGYNSELTYNVYRQDEILASNLNVTEYIDSDPLNGEICYYIEAVKDDVPIAISNDVCFNIFINVDENNAFNTSIYPNPANDFITIDAENIENVRIISLTGICIYEEETNTNSLTINTEKFINGSYIIQIRTSDGLITKHLSINK